MIVGLCTGILPAAVCAVSRGLDDVIDLGLKTISLAFNLAVESGRRSEAIEAGSGYWGFSILNVPIDTLEQVISEFHTQKVKLDARKLAEHKLTTSSQNIPTHKHAYLSVVSDGWATLSGPPSLLQELFAYSEILTNAPKLRLPFGAAAHAPHLPPLDLDALLDASGISDDFIVSHSKLMSTNTCVPYHAKTLRQIFRGALDDTTRGQLRLSGTVQVRTGQPTFPASFDFGSDVLDIFLFEFVWQRQLLIFVTNREC